MNNYIVRYTLPYDHIVEVGIKASSAKAAAAKACRAFDNGTLWDNTPEMPLLQDSYEEANHGDHGVSLEFEAEMVKDFPDPHPGVLIEATEEASEKLVTEIAHLMKFGEPDENGKPYEASDGTQDSHDVLMVLIDKAREVLSHRNGMWQPEEDVFPKDLASFCVFSSLEAGRARYPRISESKWVRYKPGDIEEPTFVG